MEIHLRCIVDPFQPTQSQPSKLTENESEPITYQCLLLLDHWE